MLGQLFVKECKQTARSLIFWAIVLILIFDFVSQLGDMSIKAKPQPGEDYGIKASDDPDLIMKSTLGNLMEEYVRESYTTYPIGFYKSVTLNQEDDQRIGEILKEATGIADREAAEKVMEEWYAAQQETEASVENGSKEGDTGNMGPIYLEPLQAEPVEGLTYQRFGELMDEADDILGGGSDYRKESRKKSARIPKTYEEALEEYNHLIEDDRLTGGYARLFSDYMVIFLGILPVFLAVTRGLRDRRAMMQELIYTRKCSSFTIMASRFLSMVVMLTLPVLILSLIPLSECLGFAQTAGITVDMLAFVKYVFGWQVPTIMAVTAVGMFITELTDTAAAVLVQGAWWFMAVFSSISDLSGGNYGWNLVPRHNSALKWQEYQDGFTALLANRLLYTVLALVFVVLTALVYTQKRKGRLQIRGKIFANRKSKSEV